MIGLFCTAPAQAQGSGQHRAIWRTPTFASAIVVDAESGTVLYEKKPHTQRAPASLVKLMLELLVLEAIERHEISFEDRVRVTQEAARVRGSRVRLRAGELVSVQDLLAATAIASGNDAAIALAIHLEGSTIACVERMNRRARELGMHETTYASVHGLETGNAPSTLTTAWDQAILSRHLVRFPEALRLSNTTTTTIRGGQTIRTTNRLLRRFPGIDGLKTGTTSRAGYCLVTTSERGGWRLISVVLGAAEGWRRFNESANLLYEAFLDWQKVRAVSQGEDLGEILLVRDGTAGSVRLVAGADLDVLIPARLRDQLRLAISAPPTTRAPVVEGWKLGQVEVLLGDSVLTRCPAVAAKTVGRIGPG